METGKFTKETSSKNPSIYRKIYENSVPLLLVFYSDYRVLSANPGACSLFGMTEEELCKHFLTDMVDHGDPRLINLVEAAEKTGKTSGEITLVRKNGSRFSGEINSSTFTDENGELIIVIGIMELFDHIKEDEEEWRKNFAQYQLAIEATNDGIWDMDMKTNQVFLSPNALNWLGYMESKTLHRDELCDNIIYKDDIPVIEKELDSATTGQTDRIDIEFRLKTVSARMKWIRLRGKVILHDSEGKGIRIIGTFTDISNLKQTESELERSRKEFQSYFDSASVGLTVATPDKSWIAVNEKACQILGYRKEELLRLSWVDLVHPDDLQDHFDHYKLALEGKIDNAAFNTRFIRKDGRIVNIDLSAVCCRNEDGTVHHFLASHTDITEQKRLQQKIIESETYYRTLIEISPDGIVIADLQMHITYASKKALEIFRIPSDNNVCGTSVLNWIIPEYHQEVIKRYSDIESGNIFPVIHEHKLLKYDKTVFWAELSSSPIIDPKGGKNGVLLVCRDITDRKKAEEELKKSQVQLLNALRIARLGAWEFDVERDTFIFNDAFYSIFRTTAAQVDGYEMKSEEYARRFIHPDDQFLLDSEISKAIESDNPGSGRQLEHRFKYADGETGYLSVQYFIIKNEKGKTVKTYGVNQDITDRKKIEIELIKAKERAEESDRLKTAFLHNISHEIRTPLNAIVGFSALLDDPDITTDQQQSFIEIINKSSDHLLSIINDIFEISNIEAGITNVNENDFDLHDLLKYLFDQFHPDCENKKIQLKHYTGIPDEKVIIRSDKTKLLQILSNLLSNSLKFTDAGIINFGCTMERTELHFYVSDSGKGIPEDKYDQIFDRFYQVEHSENRLNEGTGLGLSICKGYIELLGGHIWLNSSVGEGTTFYFTIPLNRIKTSIVNDETLYIND
jgi:PAS domain S-box-containing protein